MATPEDEIWQWAGSGAPDKRPDRGRTYYKQVCVHRRQSNKKRYFKVGDAVVMSGDDAQVWIAQIVNLFQAHQNDIHIKELLRNSTARNDDESRHELMRCTLRWFYNINDMNHHTLNTSRLPKPIPDEIWFSDHVEQDGYNDVQVIEGKAWLFPTTQAKQAFIKDPDPTFDRRKDALRVVRCFVDSKTDHLPVRELERTELERLLRNPTTDKDLFENSRLRLYGSAGAVLKGTGKKKRRHTTIRSPINVTQEEFSPSPREKKSRIHAVEAKVELGLKGAPDAGTERTKARTIRRRKIDDNDDEDDRNTRAKPSMNQGIDDDDDDEPLTNRIQELDRQQQADARRIERENEEVFAWVTELNDSALNEDLDENPKSSGKLLQPLKPAESAKSVPLAKPTKSGRPAHLAKPSYSAKPRKPSEVKELSAVGKGGVSRRYSDVNGRQPNDQKPRRREPETIVIDDDGDVEEASSRRAQKGKALPSGRVARKDGNNRQSKAGKSPFTGKPFMPTQRSREAALAVAGKSKSSIAGKAEKSTAQKKSLDALSRRQSSEKVSNVLQKATEHSQVRKDASQSSHQGSDADHYTRPEDKQFFVEITAAMDRMKIGLAKMPSESKSIVKGKMEWIVDSVIDKMFDGRKERAHNGETNEARRIADLTLKELQQSHMQHSKGHKHANPM